LWIGIVLMPIRIRIPIRILSHSSTNDGKSENFTLFYINISRQCHDFQYFLQYLYWHFMEKVQFSLMFGWNGYDSGSGSAGPGCSGSGYAKIMPIRPDPDSVPHHFL
jgi:hypothetical protein